jgi:hypothetical protein
VSTRHHGKPGQDRLGTSKAPTLSQNVPCRFGHRLRNRISSAPSAWLHDIGYAPGLAVTGLHVLDGARYLRDARHADTMLSRLVAHHSYAIVEAGKRGLAGVLVLEFEPAPHVLSAVLTYCEMTTSPDGELGRSKGDSPRSITATAPGTWSAGQSSVPRR